MNGRRLDFELDGVDGGVQLQQVMPQLGAAIASVQPGDLERSTPCASWTVRDLLNHIIGGAEMFADAIAGAPVRDISGRLPDVIGNDPVVAFERAAGRFGEALQQEGAMQRVLELPFGPMTVKSFLRFAAFDLTVHTWDVASVTGETVAFPDELLHEIESFARVVLESVPRTDRLCAAPVDAPADATPLQRIVAYSGRGYGASQRAEG
jgi:uncharacterized protein (TIGR03086 family)